MVSMINYIILWICYTGFIVYHSWYSFKMTKKMADLSWELYKKENNIKEEVK